jgi:heptosyltransferase-1
MKVLIVRLTSMGDVVQTLPAIEDASRAVPDISFDWVVEESFADIPAWHSRVEKVIASSLRRWKKDAAAAIKNKELTDLIKSIRSTKYDAVIDLQGEMKSAMLTRLARGKRFGYDSRSVHEWGAQAAYHRRFRVTKGRHSITRMRELMAKALGYAVPAVDVEYGVDSALLPTPTIDLPKRFVVLVHSTSWKSKNWHEDRWCDLASIAASNGYTPVIPWGSQSERERSERIAGDVGVVLPEMSIADKAAIISRASAVVGLDTGLTHIAAAFDVPGLSIYGATDPLLVGATGRNQVNLTSTFECRFCHLKKCIYDVPPEMKPACLLEFEPAGVWRRVEELIG